MSNRLLRIICLCAIVLAVVTNRPHVANAFVNRASVCRINTGIIGWGGDTAMHPNGLLYVSRVVSGYNTLRDRGFIAILAINPNAVGEGTCPVVSSYLDIEDNYTTLTVLVNPAVSAVDSDGNVYVGKGAANGFRMLVIPKDAPSNDPFRGLLKRRITGAFGKSYFSGSAIATTATHIAVGLMPFNPGDKVTGSYGVVSIASVLSNNPTVSTTWRPIGGDIYNSIAGMPNGQFLVLGDKRSGGIWGVVYDPFTQLEKNPLNLALNGASTTIGCGPPVWGCQTPQPALGNDGNMYITVLAVGGALDRATYIWKFDMTTMRWTGINGEAGPTLIPRYITYENLQGGANIFVDSSGNIASTMGLGFKRSNGQPGRFGYAVVYNRSTSTWSEKYIDTADRPILGSPDLLIADVNGQERMFAIYTAWASETNHSININTYVTPVKGAFAKCRPSLSLEGGAAFINTTTASGVVYTKSSCIAKKYYAVATNSSTPPTADTNNLKPFSVADGTIAVSGLTPNATNYIHVQLFDEANKSVDSWMSTSLYVDQVPTVAATATLSSPSTEPYYLDSSSMRGSSYTAAGFTRSNTGILKITGVTDPSGLNTYKVDNGSAVTYLPSMLNQSIPVSLNAITTTVGISLTLTDGAGNNETRGLRTLIMDTDPPVVSSPPNVSFLPSSSDSFSGTLTVDTGGVTDTIYASQTTGKDYWGLWIANAPQTSGVCPSETSTDLRWGAVPVDSASPSVSWNLLNGLKTPVASGTYCTFVRFLDGAGNPSTTTISTTTTVNLSTTYKSFTPIVFGQR